MTVLKKESNLYGAYFPTRLYGVQDMNTVLEGIVTDGIIELFDTDVVISFTVRVTLGLAKALGVKSRKTVGETIDFIVDAPDSLNRIDSIFYRVDLSSDKRDTIVYRSGIAGTFPSPPDPDISNPTLIKELRLCDITVDALVSSLSTGDIDNTVQEASTVVVLVENAVNAELAEVALVAVTASEAIGDGVGNNIVATYARKDEIDEAWVTIADFTASPRSITTSTSGTIATFIANISGYTELEVSYSFLTGRDSIKKIIIDVSGIASWAPVTYDTVNNGFVIEQYGFRLWDDGGSLRAYYSLFKYWDGVAATDGVVATNTNYIFKVRAR